MISWSSGSMTDVRQLKVLSEISILRAHVSDLLCAYFLPHVLSRVDFTFSLAWIKRVVKFSPLIFKLKNNNDDDSERRKMSWVDSGEKKMKKSIQLRWVLKNYTELATHLKVITLILFIFNILLIRYWAEIEGESRQFVLIKMENWWTNWKFYLTDCMWAFYSQRFF